jgi:hypothetical protein
MSMLAAVAPRFITRAPRDVAGWARLFDPAALPVLAATAAEIETLAPIEEEVDAHGLAEQLGSDPLMVLKIMAHLARLRRGREGSDTETLTAALVMLGIPPFFRTFANQPTVEERLAAEPEALAGFREVLRRSHRAARFAIAFAVHRLDRDAAVIHDAAVLHDFAELLLWLNAPALALEIARRQRADPQLRSAAAQREVLHIELADLQHQLMLDWRLPALLVAITDDHARRETPQLANVRLAIRVARHSAQGWDNPALPDDIAAVGDLLQLSAPHVQRLLLDIDNGA